MNGMTAMIAFLSVSGALFILGTVAIILLLRFRRTYVFTVHGHEAAVRITSAGLFLYVDGRLEEQISGRSMRLATLHATIDGEEFKAHVSVGNIFRINIEATHGGRDVVLIHVER